jgi:alpha-L-rhamnosidase
VENILVEDTEIGSGNGLITCGSEATIVRNVLVKNCVMSGSATMLTLKLRPDTPQRYENITIDGVRLAGTGRMVSMAPWKQFFDLKGMPAPSRSVKNVTIRNISGSYGRFGGLRGNPGDELEDFTFENIDVILTDERLMVGDIKNVTMRNVTVNGKAFSLPSAK